jgi:hypothetical protein
MQLSTTQSSTNLLLAYLNEASVVSDYEEAASTFPVPAHREDMGEQAASSSSWCSTGGIRAAALLKGDARTRGEFFPFFLGFLAD